MRETTKKLNLKTMGLSTLVVAALSTFAPLAALADYAEVLGGQSTNSLRNPLIPGAASSAPGQFPLQGQPPAIGDGFMPAPVIPGDMGPSFPIPSGMSDPTHGNFFPGGMGGPTKGPQNYVPGAGRRATTNGAQQGMFEYGQGQRGGQNIYEGGQGQRGGQNIYEGGVGNGGQATYNSGMGNGGQRRYDNGQSNGGQSTVDNGQGNGGQSTVDNGQGNGGQRKYDSGEGNGGQSTVNNGGAGSGAQGLSNNGGASSGAQGLTNNGGAGSGAQGLSNNGGPASGAQAEQDRQFSNTKQTGKYEFQGPLPTVKTFSRYLVILGVVAATIFVAIAGWSVVFGSQYGASRVIGAVGGLLLLLGGYTIWKIVQMNTFNANSTGVTSKYRAGPPMGLQPYRGQSPQSSFNGPIGPAQDPGN